MRSNLAVVCVAYVPEWEPLADALTRVMTSGVNEQQAKIEICQAIADKKIDIRVEIEKAAPDVGGKTLSGRNIDVPPRLHPDDFDWVQSRPLKPWETGPDSSNPSERYYSLWSWKPRSINFLEVRTSDVTAVLCTVTPQTKSLNLAPRSKISAAIKAVYDAADSAGEKPPNIKELPAKIQPTLAAGGYRASGRLIQEVGESPEFKRRRRQPGRTLSSERHPRKK